MSGRKTYILANWKMHFSVGQSVAFAEKLASKKIPDGVEVAVAPQTLAVEPVAKVLADSEISVIAQNAYFEDEGAFTGEVSMSMLRGIADYALVGHSERRHVFHESNEQTKYKMMAAVRNSISPILCVGETLVEREHHHTGYVLNDQLTAGLANLTAQDIEKIDILYEPVWAIGTGKFARPDDALSAASQIRNDIAQLYGYDAANKCRILYGGSVDKNNCGAYLALDGIDGLGVGSASLSVSGFWSIVEAAGKSVAARNEATAKQKARG